MSRSMKSQFLRSDQCSVDTNTFCGYARELSEYCGTMRISETDRFINVSSFEGHSRTLTKCMKLIAEKGW